MKKPAVLCGRLSLVLGVSCDVDPVVVVLADFDGNVSFDVDGAGIRGDGLAIDDIAFFKKLIGVSRDESGLAVVLDIVGGDVDVVFVFDGDKLSVDVRDIDVGDALRIGT